MHQNKLEYSQPAVNAQTKDILLSPAFKMALAIRLIERNRSALDIANWLCGTIFFYDGPLFDHENQQIEISECLIDQRFGYLDNDAWDHECAFEWFDDLKAYATKAPRRRSHHRLLGRLELLDLAFKIVGKPIQV